MTLNIIAQLLADIAAWPRTLVDRLHMISLKKKISFYKYLQDYQFPRYLADQKFRNHVSLTRKNFRMDMGCEKSFNIFPFIRVGFQLFAASVFSSKCFDSPAFVLSLHKNSVAILLQT